MCWSVWFVLRVSSEMSEDVRTGVQECHHNVLEYEFSSSSSSSSSRRPPSSTAARDGSHVSVGGLSLSTVFSTMEDVCRDLSPIIDHYSLSQNTLDNVCLPVSFAVCFFHSLSLSLCLSLMCPFCRTVLSPVFLSYCLSVLTSAVNVPLVLQMCP